MLLIKKIYIIKYMPIIKTYIKFSFKKYIFLQKVC